MPPRYKARLGKLAPMGEAGRATALLSMLQDQTLGLSVFAICELLAGARAASDPASEGRRVSELLTSLEVVHTHEELPSRYAEVLHHLRLQGKTIATMDLLIGVTALLASAPLVTRNERHFSRIPGLSLLSY